MSNPVVVIGGGISGLSAAFYLHKLGHTFLKHQKIILLEGSERMGGWMHSKRMDDGVIHELGPRSIRFAGDSGTNTLLLVESLGLSKEVIAVSKREPAAKKRLLYLNDQFVQLPNGFLDLFKKKPPFKQRFYKYLLDEQKKPKLELKDDDDISVYDFIEKRFDKDIADFIIDPLCRGITAGDAKKLSMKSAFPQLFKLEREHGSLIKGLLRPTIRKRTEQEIHDLLSSRLLREAKAQKWSMWSLRNGIQTLPEKLADYLHNLEDHRVEIYKDSKVTQIDFDGDIANITIKTPDETVELQSSHVFSAIPANSLSKCLNSDRFSKFRDRLNSIEHINVAVVNLEFLGKNRLKDRGFGFLTPSSSKSPLLGVTFDSSSFPQQDAGKDITRVTCMIGGTSFSLSNGSAENQEKHLKLLKTAIEWIKKCLAFEDEPIRYNVAINEYNVGHSRTLNAIDDEIKAKRCNMSLIGASYRGISVNECIHNSRQAVVNFFNSNNK
ncbi:protoporphyrinogen oxidase-like protein [Dinothrombium tinctorium]|uniref:Protoporphyrinogen oxidase n=1 Tax=Dinothrombium tinctorium TaxID=1965070 RepID=A0A443R462_9ACAR|nr:protoporphyrinogen oxidase-like protein [Dinothrombium tinctorium]